MDLDRPGHKAERFEEILRVAIAGQCQRIKTGVSPPPGPLFDGDQELLPYPDTSGIGEDVEVGDA